MEAYVQSEYLANLLYADEDIGSILWSEAFRTVRERFPPSWSWASGGDLVLLLKEKPAVIEADLKKRLSGALDGSIGFEHLEPEQDADIESFVVSADGVVVCLAFGSRPYATQESIRESAMVKRPLQRALSEHQGYVLIGGICASRARGDAVDQLTRQVAAALLDERCMALYFAKDSRLVSNGQELQQLLAGQETLETQQDWGEDAWLSQDDAHAKDETERFQQRRRDLLQELRKSLGNDGVPEAPLQLLVPFKVGGTAETHWLELVRAWPEPYYGWEIIGRLQTDSRINPRFRAGECIRLSSYSVNDWKAGGPVDRP
jgi:hypothetical protein